MEIGLRLQSPLNFLFLGDFELVQLNLMSIFDGPDLLEQTLEGNICFGCLLIRGLLKLLVQLVVLPLQLPKV